MSARIRRAVAALLFAFAAAASAETIVADTILTQTWRKAGSPYRIGASAVVPAGERLTIEPGVEVVLDDTAYHYYHVRLEIAGRLVAVGTETENIRFSGWGNVEFAGSDSSTVRFVRMSGFYAEASSAVVIRDSARVGFSRSAIEGYSPRFDGIFGVTATGSVHATFDSCVVGRTHHGGTYGVSAGGSARLTFTACEIVDIGPPYVSGGAFSVGGDADVTIRKGVIAGIVGGGEGGAVAGVYGGQVVFDGVTIAGYSSREDQTPMFFVRRGSLSVRNMIIAPNRTWDRASGSLDPNVASIEGGEAVFDHVTFPGGVGFWWDPPFFAVRGGSLSVRNTIVYTGGEEESGSIVGISSGRVSITYSDIDGGYPGEGNIDADPLLTGDEHLGPDSPCIDAGDPASPLDPDGTRADIGAFPFDHRAPSALADIHPLAFSLSQNAPNPFNPSTAIRFSLAAAGEARLTVHDVTGGLVRTLVDGPRAAGAHEVAWDGRDATGRTVASGVYLYRLVAPDGAMVRRTTLVR